MPSPEARMSLWKILAGYASAGNAHDIDAMMSFFTDDCEFYSAIGPDVYGTRYIGIEKVREGLLHFLAICPNGRWINTRFLVTGNRGLMEWTFIGTTHCGQPIEVNGCDLITFKGGKIAIKNSYRKNRVEV
jgi:hypothetical protein